MRPAAPDPLLSRRTLLVGGAVAGWGAALALAVDAVAQPPDPSATPAADGSLGTAVVPFHGVHQAGVAVPPQAHSTYLALDLAAGTDAGGLRRLMRLLSDDAARLTAGRGALADQEPELAAAPARLTVTFGFGPGLVTAAGGRAPTWLAPLPAFAVDRLQDAWSGGDLLLEVAADDPTTVAHAVRVLLRDARAFASLRWQQRGFRHSAGSHPPGATMRNLFGQLDGTANPVPGSADFEELVWVRDGWLAGGTSLVVRRIAMDLDGWDRVSRVGREQAVGRRLGTGAPLTGTAERDEPDLDAVDPLGFPVIPAEAHLRRARTGDPRTRFYRRGYSYDDAPADGGLSSTGLIFTAFQADPVAQFVPVQQRLAELDLMNTWTTPIGSAVVAVPPGCAPGGYIGETLLE